MCKFLWSVSRRGPRTRNMCVFLRSLTRLEPTAIGGELWIACTGTGVSTGGGAHSSPLYLWYGPRSPRRVYKLFFLRQCLDLSTTDRP